MSFVFLVINNKAVVDYNVVQILSEVKIQEIIFHFWVSSQKEIVGSLINEWRFHREHCATFEGYLTRGYEPFNDFKINVLWNYHIKCNEKYINNLKQFRSIGPCVTTA